MMSKKRIMMAYEIFYNNNKEKALSYFQDVVKLSKRYPVKGDADMELMLVNWMKESKLPISD